MFLLNDEMILRYQKEGLLDMENLNRELIHPTYCYFRLGSPVRVWDGNRKEYHLEELGEPGKEVLTIPPRGYVLIQSLERFTCSKKVLGIFGQVSALARKGLRLNHSPTIDPNFRGYLEMGLENLLDRPRELQYRELIGKVLFFDVSDTYPVPDIRGTLSEKDYKRRETLRGAEPL